MTNQSGTAATGIYGTPVKDAAGNVVGTEKFDTKTGKPLQQPKTEEATPNPTATVKDTLGNSYNASMPEDMTYQLPGLAHDKKWVFDAQGKPFEMDSKGVITAIDFNVPVPISDILPDIFPLAITPNKILQLQFSLLIEIPYSPLSFVVI